MQSHSGREMTALGCVNTDTAMPWQEIAASATGLLSLYGVVIASWGPSLGGDKKLLLALVGSLIP